MQCFKCDKLTNNYKADKETCAACREVFKIDLVKVILGLDPIYLSESNRNKKGRKPKLTPDDMNDIPWKHNHEGESLGSLAKEYGVSKATIFNIVHKNDP